MTQPTPEQMLAEMRAMAEEPLHEDLQPYVEDLSFGQSLRHPLVYQVPLTMPGQANRLYANKREVLDEAIAEQEWSTAVWLYERPYRTWALIEYVVGKDEDDEPVSLADLDQETRDLAADVWVDSENLGQHSEEWDAMLSGASGLVLASEQEQEEFAALPETLTVYRGEIDDAGWSWTTDPKVALFFARRFGANEALVQGEVAKADVIGYLTRRNESEVLVPQGKVTHIRPFAPEEP